MDQPERTRPDDVGAESLALSPILLFVLTQSSRAWRGGQGQALPLQFLGSVQHQGKLFKPVAHAFVFWVGFDPVTQDPWRPLHFQ